MDEIIVINGGKAIERGSHKELLALNGTYRQLWDDQRHRSSASDDDDDEDDDDE
jgi:ATP-binding cassette subfamily B protein